MKKICFFFFFFISFLFIINVIAKEVMEAKYLNIADLQTYIKGNEIKLFVPINYSNVKVYSYTYYLSGKKIAKTKENSYLYKNLEQGRRYLLKVEINTSEGIKQKDTTVTLKEEQPSIKIEKPNEWTATKTVTINFLKNNINYLSINKGDVLLKQGIIDNKVPGNVLQIDTVYPVITRKMVLEIIKPTLLKIKTKVKDEEKIYNIQIDKIDILAPVIKAKNGVFQIPYGTDSNTSNYFTIRWGKSGEGKINCNPSNTNVLDYGNNEITCTAISLNGLTSEASKTINITS